MHNLHHFIDARFLQESYKKLNKKSAEGIHGKTWLEYGKELPERRESLLAEFKSGRYKAPALWRVYIPKVTIKRREPIRHHLTDTKTTHRTTLTRQIISMFLDTPNLTLPILKQVRRV